MRKFQLIFVSCFFLSPIYFAQKSNIWFFGANAGLNFNFTPPLALNNGMINNPDNTSTISDASGNLLFYTDGLKVWNRNHQIMSNGNGLLGSFTAGQGSLIVPVPCDSNKYAIFYTTDFSNPGYLRYSVVDMTLAGGFGDVISNQKNISLGSGWTEKLCAYYNAANNNFWVVSHRWNSDEFVAFSVSTQGIATQSVVSSVGSMHNCGSVGGAHDGSGQLTISPDGMFLLNALTCKDQFELFNFNSTTGVVSNLIVIPGNSKKAWGTGFSADSKKIFTTDIFGQDIYQYDISVYATQQIISSQYLVASVSTTGYNFGYVELGPDQKLYIARPGSNFLAVVNNPNILGPGCNFALAGQSLSNKLSTHGLSRIAYNIPTNLGSGTLTISASPSSICPGQTSTIIVYGANTYTWSTGATNSIIVVAPLTNSLFSVTGDLVCASSASTSILVVPLPQLLISGADKICSGATTTLSASGASSYIWVNNGTNSTLVVSPTVTTTYSLIGLNSLGCAVFLSRTLFVDDCATTLSENQVLYEVPTFFPNPFNSEINILLREQAEVSFIFQIYSHDGSLIKTCEIFSSERELTFDLEFLSAGIYFFELKNQSFSKRVKVVKL